MIRVFISQPMNDKTNEDIKKERDRAIEIIKEEYKGENVEIIDSFIENAPHEAKPLWFLGMSFTLLSGADLAFFIAGWEDYRGCKMEHEACVQYKIDHIDEYKDHSLSYHIRKE